MSTPDRITKLIPRARPVSLAGTVYPIWEFRLQDLATLQGWLDDEWVDPLDGVEEALTQGKLSPEEREDLFFEAHEAVEQGPPVDGSLAATLKFSTRQGLCAFLITALARSRPAGRVFAYSEITHILDHMTTPEYLKLRRVCFGASSFRTLTQKLMGYDAPGENSGTWAESIDEVARSHGWTYEYIYSLTITEFVNARREGKPVDEDFSASHRPDQAKRYAAHLARKYQKFDDVTESNGVIPEAPAYV